MLNDLRDAGLVEFGKKVDSTNIRVTCIDDDSPVVARITDFRNLGFQYSMLNGERFIECACCGMVVKPASNRQKYCKSCALEVNRTSALRNYKS